MTHYGSVEGARVAQGGAGASWVSYDPMVFADFATYDFKTAGAGIHTAAATGLPHDTEVAYDIGTPDKLSITNGVGLEVDVLTGAAFASLIWIANDFFPSYAEDDKVRFLLELATFPETNGARAVMQYRNAANNRRAHWESQWSGGAFNWRGLRYDGASNEGNSAGGATMNTVGLLKMGEGFHGLRATSGLEPALGPLSWCSFNRHPGSGGSNWAVATDEFRAGFAAVNGYVVKQVVPQRFE